MADKVKRVEIDPVREKLARLLEDALDYSRMCRDIKRIVGGEEENPFKAAVDYLVSNGATVQVCARPLKEWGEDYGDVLWWKFPIEEPPYVGSPLDENWPAYHTHWTPIILPLPPERRMNTKPRNEVIQALKCYLVNEGDPCDGCPYYREDGYCIDNVMADALELLQESAEGE